MNTLNFLFFQGQKGETGPAGKSPQGAVKFGDTAEKCTLQTAGTVRYNVSQKALQLCDGSAWLPLVIGGEGHVVNRPGLHCMDILKSGEIFIFQRVWKMLDLKKIPNHLNALFKVAVVIADCTGSIQTEAR